MKLMRKNWKDRKGVSPVIATILMVAITVVLAAVLYVMVMGFGGDSDATPKVALTKVDDGAGLYTISVVSVSGGSIDIEKVKVAYSPTNLVTYVSDEGDHMTLNSAAGLDLLSAGDYVQFKGNGEGGKVTVSLIDGDSGDGLGSITLDVAAPT